MKNISFILFFIILYSFFLHAQKNQEIQVLDERLKTLETRLLSLEDFTQQQLQAILNEKSRDHSFQEQQKLMQEAITKLQQQLADTQAEVLRLKITLANIQKGNLSPTPDPTEKIPEPTSEFVGYTYRNPEIVQYAKLMQAPESSIRIGAVLQMSRIEDEEANQALLSGISDDDPYVKMLIIKSLAKRKARIALPALLDLMMQPNADIRAVSAKAIQEITQSKELFPYSASLEERQKAIQTWKKKIEK